jgi:hypothetical protein
VRWVLEEGGYKQAMEWWGKDEKRVRDSISRVPMACEGPVTVGDRVIVTRVRKNRE